MENQLVTQLHPFLDPFQTGFSSFPHQCPHPHAGDLRIEAPRSWLNGAPVAILPAPTHLAAPAKLAAPQAPPEPQFRFDALAQQLQRLQDPWDSHIT